MIIRIWYYYDTYFVGLAAMGNISYHTYWSFDNQSSTIKMKTSMAT